MLYTFGSNLFGQLGITESDESDKPIIHPFFKEKKVLKVVCGQLHTLVLCDGNELYSFGNGDEGALGRKGDSKIPKKIKFNANIADIAAGSCFSAILTKRGQVWACGTFRSSQGGLVGFKSGTDIQFKFEKLNIKSIKSIYAGLNVLIMINNKKQLFTYGTNDCFVLGRDNPKREAHKLTSLLNPLRITNGSSLGFNMFKTASCGEFHAVAVKETNECYTWGGNGSGQLGLPEIEFNTYEKHKVKIENVSDAHCGNNHSVFLTTSGEVYCCGDNSYNQCESAEKAFCNEPKLVLNNVDLVRAGGDFVIAKVDGKLYGWGNNDSNEICGSGSVVQSPTPIDFDFGNILDVQCGFDYTFVLTE